VARVEGWPPRWLTPTTPAERNRGDGAFAAEFIEQYCRVVKESVGGTSGSQIILRPWQRNLLDWSLARKAEGKKKHRQALIGMPRKSGKSAILSSLALYELLLGPEGGEVYTVASSRDQARIVFGTTRRMVEMDPELNESTKLFKDAIEVPSTGSVMRVMAAEAPQLEGLNPTYVIVDEVHALPDDELWNVFSLAMAARPDPQMIGITTAGVKYNRFGSESLAYRLYLYGQRIAGGEVNDPSFGMAWWAPKSANADHRDPKVWREANPGFGDLQSEEDFEAAVLRTPESEWRTKRLNMWVDAQSAWLPEGAWEACAKPGRIPAGTDVVLALDGSFNGDSTALVAVEIPATEDGIPHVHVAGAWERPPNADEHWSVDILDVEARIRECARTWQVREIACDPYRWARTMQVLSEERLPVTEFPQSAQRMTPATTRMYEAVVNKKMTHDGDVRLTRHIAAAVLKVDQRGQRLAKESRGTSRRIDLAVCSVMALDRAAWWAGEGRRRTTRRVVAF
jgi:phage terminase large subunit-like protein